MTTLLLSLWTVSLVFVGSQAAVSLEREVLARGSERSDRVRERVLNEWLLYGGLGI